MTSWLQGLVQAAWQRITAGKLRQNILTLAGGNAIAQLVTIAAAPVLARLYVRADYGVLTAMSTLVGLLAILATGRFQLAIPLPDSRREARQLLVIALGMAMVSSVFVGLAVWWYAGPIFTALRIPGAAAYWWFIPGAMAGIAIYESLYHWALRNKEFRLLTQTRVTQALTGTTTTVGMGILGSGPLGLLLGAILSQGSGITRLAKFALAPAPATVGPSDDLGSRLGSTFRSYRTFAGFSCLGALLNALGVALAPILLIRFYGEEAGGSYGFAYRLITVPMLLVGNAISQVFLAEAASQLTKRPEYIRHLHHTITRRAVGFGIGLVAIGVLSPILFPLVFGREWSQAGVFAAWMTCFCAAQLVVSPVSNLAVLLRRQDLQCALDLLRVVIILPSLIVPHWLGATVTQTVACYSICMFCLYGVYYAAYARLARNLGSHSPLANSSSRL